MAPVDKSPTARPIRFGVALPASWSGRGAQLGGGGMNGTIPRLTGGVGRTGAPLISQGFATYGSDSGHQAAFGPPPGAPRGAGREGGPGQAPAAGAAPPTGAPRAAMGPPPAMAPPDPAANDWTLNDEAIANLGYMQLKKTHDAAMVLIERVYGAKPRYNYFFGNSQGGREALTVAQRYPGRLRRHLGRRADRQLLVADARARADSHPGEAARQLGDAGQGQRDSRASSCASATGSTASPTASSTTTWRAARSST